MRSLEPLLYRFFLLHARMQRRLRHWHDNDAANRHGRGYVNFMEVPWLKSLQTSLGDTLDAVALTARLTRNLADLERFAELLLRMAGGAAIERDGAGFDNVGALVLGSHRGSAHSARSAPCASAH
jgi:hypothetical protein